MVQTFKSLKNFTATITMDLLAYTHTAATANSISEAEWWIVLFVNVEVLLLSVCISTIFKLQALFPVHSNEEKSD